LGHRAASGGRDAPGRTATRIPGSDNPGPGGEARAARPGESPASA
jgi:hypothetical protein